MKTIKSSHLKAILVASCLLIIMSFFMTWANIVVVHVSAFDLAMGAFSGGSPRMIQRFMFILLVMPIIAIIQVGYEYFKKRCYWFIYLINALIILVCTIYYSSVSTADIGFIITIVCAVILCLVSIGLKYASKQGTDDVSR